MRKQTEISGPEIKILIGAHFAASFMSVFTLLSQMRWDV